MKFRNKIYPAFLFPFSILPWTSWKSTPYAMTSKPLRVATGDQETLTSVAEMGTALTFLGWSGVLAEIRKYSRLSLSRIPRDSLKHFDISVPRHISVAEVRKKINRTTTFNKWICNLTPEVRDILNIVEKRRNCSWGAISPLFHNILLPVLRLPC